MRSDLTAIHLTIASLVELTKLVLPGRIKRDDGRTFMLGISASAQASSLLANHAATEVFIAGYTDALINELKDTRVRATLLVSARLFLTGRFPCTGGGGRNRISGGRVYSFRWESPGLGPGCGGANLIHGGARHPLPSR